MIIPDIVLAIALLSFFTLLNVTLGLHSIIISHAVFNIAFVCVIVRTRLKNFDRSIVEASIDLGASEVRTFWRITLPVILPGVDRGGAARLHARRSTSSSSPTSRRARGRRRPPSRCRSTP